MSNNNNRPNKRLRTTAEFEGHPMDRDPIAMPLPRGTPQTVIELPTEHSQAAREAAQQRMMSTGPFGDPTNLRRTNRNPPTTATAARVLDPSDLSNYYRDPNDERINLYNWRQNQLVYRIAAQKYYSNPNNPFPKNIDEQNKLINDLARRVRDDGEDDFLLNALRNVRIELREGRGTNYGQLETRDDFLNNNRREIDFAKNTLGFLDDRELERLGFYVVPPGDYRGGKTKKRKKNKRKTLKKNKKNNIIYMKNHQKKNKIKSLHKKKIRNRKTIKRKYIGGTEVVQPTNENKLSVMGLDLTVFKTVIQSLLKAYVGIVLYALEKGISLITGKKTNINSESTDEVIGLLNDKLRALNNFVDSERGKAAMTELKESLEAFVVEINKITEGPIRTFLDSQNKVFSEQGGKLLGNIGKSMGNVAKAIPGLGSALSAIDSAGSAAAATGNLVTILSKNASNFTNVFGDFQNLSGGLVDATKKLQQSIMKFSTILIPTNGGAFLQTAMKLTPRELRLTEIPDLSNIDTSIKLITDKFVKGLQNKS